MTEHDLLVRVQKQIEGLKAQVAGLVIERDALAEMVQAGREAVRDAQLIDNTPEEATRVRRELLTALGG